MPVVILAIITVVLIVMFLYEQSVEQSKMHMALRAEAGHVTERMECTGSDWDGTVTTGSFKVTASQGLAMRHNGLLKVPGQHELNGCWTTADGVKYARLKQARQ